MGIVGVPAIAHACLAGGDGRPQLVTASACSKSDCGLKRALGAERFVKAAWA
jgi:hypothetical protein